MDALTFPPFLAVLEKFAFAFGALGIVAGMGALALRERKSERATAVGILAVVLGIVPPALGLLAMQSRIAIVEEAVAWQGRGAVALHRSEWYPAAYGAARKGGYGGIAPLLLGAVAIFGARKKRPAGRVAIALATITTCGALVAAARPKPPYVSGTRARLMDARDMVDIDRARGCRELRNAVTDYGWDGKKWPRELPPDVRDAVPDYDAIGSRCVRWGLATGADYFDGGVLQSPLLVDEALKKELENDTDLFPCMFGCGGDDPDYGGYGVLGDPGPRKNVRFATELRTLTGPTDYPPKVLLRIVGRTPVRIGLRRCPQTPPGKVTVKIVVERSGKVTSAMSIPETVSDAGPDVPDPAFAACVARVFERVIFPPPDGTVTITFPVLFLPLD